MLRAKQAFLAYTAYMARYINGWRFSDTERRPYSDATMFSGLGRLMDAPTGLSGNLPFKTIIL